MRGEIAGPGRKKIRVVIADARRLIAEALRALIAGVPGFVVTDVVSLEGPEAVTAARDADLVVVGVGSELDGAPDFVRLLRALTEAAEVVILADSPEPDLLRFVLDQRLNGLLITEAQVQDFVASLDQVACGHAVLPAGWQGMLANQLNDPLSGLSDRQMEVLELLSEGCSYEQIATRLFISVNTVKFHVRSIFSQLGVHNRMAAARLLAQNPRPAPTAPKSMIY
ncbi:MAG: response regulator transcription factor [Solirubrobacterales bacterium]|nr:response regulator transcription factor [Solirubrobacterales bacterium]